jgi:hypothetical protein
MPLLHSLQKAGFGLLEPFPQSICCGKTCKLHGIFALPTVLYGRVTWFPVVREGRRWRAFENMPLRRKSGNKKDEVICNCRNLHIEKFHNSYHPRNVMNTNK